MWVPPPLHDVAWKGMGWYGAYGQGAGARGCHRGLEARYGTLSSSDGENCGR